jgi:DNA-binding MarR family transcriptional regulator
MQNLKERRKTSPGHKVSRLARLLALQVERTAAPLGIGHGQVPYMCELLYHGRLTQDELGALVGVNRSATARAVALLERKGLVSRCENPQNRRQKFVSPTARARELETAFFSALDTNNEVMFRGLSTQERRMALELLEKMAVNLDAELRGEGAA